MPTERDFAGWLGRIPELKIELNRSFAQAIGVDLPVAVINLDRRPDRWHTLSSRMAGVGLDNLIRVPAVEGAQLSLPEISPLLGPSPETIEVPPTSHLALTRPAIGCFLSHLAAWRWMIDNGLPRMLVFEDDARPSPAFDAERFRQTVEASSRDCGLILLGHIIMNGLADDPRGSDLPRIYYFNGTVAYLITPAACEFLLPRLLPMRCHIDHQMSDVFITCRHSFAARYAAPALFEPDWSLRSDCYVPLRQETEADRELGALLTARRDLLLSDGRPLLA